MENEKPTVEQIMEKKDTKIRVLLSLIEEMTHWKTSDMADFENSLRANCFSGIEASLALCKNNPKFSRNSTIKRLMSDGNLHSLISFVLLDIISKSKPASLCTEKNVFDRYSEAIDSGVLHNRVLLPQELATLPSLKEAGTSLRNSFKKIGC